MNDIAVAVLILPLLAVLVLVLECSRIGCTRLFRHIRSAPVRAREGEARPAQHSSAF